MKLEFLGEAQIEFLREGQYIEKGETVEQRFSEIVERVRFYENKYSPGLANRIEILLDKNILSLSTPSFSNVTISCGNSHIKRHCLTSRASTAFPSHTNASWC